MLSTARPTGEGERNVGAVPGPNGQEQRPLIGYLIQRGKICLLHHLRNFFLRLVYTLRHVML